jgi:hypothetical protein
MMEKYQFFKRNQIQVIKFSNEKFFKFGRQDTSDISLKYSQLSNFKTFLLSNFYIYKKVTSKPD